MRSTPLHAKVHLPLLGAALLLTLLSYLRLISVGHLGLDAIRPAPMIAEGLGLLFIIAVLLAAYGYHQALFRGTELGLSIDSTLRLAKILGIVMFFSLPLLSNDIFIYLSCGQAPLLNFNPYTEPTLLTDTLYHAYVPPIWADGPYCKYGPAAISIAQFAALIGGSSPIYGIFAWKVLVLAAYLLFCDATALLLKHFDKATSAVAPFILLCPILWVQAPGQGHNDIFAALFLVASLLALAHGRFFLSILLLTLGIQIKIYLLPLLFLFFFAWRRTTEPTGREITTFLLSGFTAAAFTILLHVPYWDGPETLAAIYGPLLTERPMNNIPYLLPYGLTAVITALKPHQESIETLLRSFFTLAAALASFWQLLRLIRKQDAPYLIFLRIMALVICFAALRFHAWYFIALLPLAAAGLPPAWIRWGALVFPLTLFFDVHNFLLRDSVTLLATLPGAVILVNLLFLHRLRERFTRPA